MNVYRIQSVYINREHPLFAWCETITAMANNLSNACRFRQRQILTAYQKDQGDWTDNERSVIDEFCSALDQPGISGVPLCPSFRTMDAVLKYHKNPDYYAEGLPRQSAQHILKQTVNDMNNYFAALRSWKEHPELFTGKPELPGYKKKGGHTAVSITNQDCTIKTDQNGVCMAGLPLIKKVPLCIGHPAGTLKQAQVCPDNGQYVIRFTFEVEMADPVSKEIPSRIAAIDFGVDNLMAVTNNCGLPCLLYKGGIVKSVNRLYNKKLADIMAREMGKPDCPKNKEGKPKFVPTEESRALTLKRNHKIMDFMHKAAKHFATWCVEHRIDTVVAGKNTGWKQKSGMGRTNNQNFVQIPFSYLEHCISYLCEAQGIRFVQQEESYTSKASFLDQDNIPAYGKTDEKAVFSGRRCPTKYKGMYKKNGFRGLYQASDGTIINADLNGSANILRKAFPDAFKTGMMPDFNCCLIIRNPEDEDIIANRQKQMAHPRPTVISHSKAKRLSKQICA